MLFTFDESITIEHDIVRRLSDNNFEVYIVGGAVRDKLLGHTPKDIDFATNAKPEEIEKIFSDKKICTVGKCFKAVKVEGVDVATYRLDRQEKLYNAKHCKPCYAGTIEEDLSRRDLTINAMAINARTGKLLDLFGGKNDLNRSIIRFVGDPIQRIKEDPNRIIRACRFLAQIEGSFSVDTLKALTSCSHFVRDHVDPERIQVEIMKAMTTKTPSIFFSALYTIGALKYIFPEMCACFEQEGGSYHNETVGEHCMLCGDLISPKFPLLRLAGYMHDIGKPHAYKKAMDGSFKEHERYGGQFTKYYLKTLRFSNEEVLTVGNLVYAHMRTCRGLTPKGIRRLHKYLADYNVNPRDYIRLKLADRQANMLKDANTFTPIKELVINAGIRRTEQNVPFTVRDLAISGGQLIEEFALKPGPIVGKIQKALLELVIEEGPEFNTYDILREKARFMLEK